MHLAGVGLMALATICPTLAAAADGDFIPGQERQIVYYSIWGGCIGEAHTPLCALDTLFSCMVRGDREMCTTVGAYVATDCRITGVRYVVDAVMQTETAARMTFRARACSDDAPCHAPSEVQTEDLERTEGRWRFRSAPHIHAQACRP